MAVLQHLLQLYIAINICLYINCPFAKMNFILAGVQIYKIMYKRGWLYMNKCCVQAQWANLRRFTNKILSQQTLSIFFMRIIFNYIYRYLT